MGQPGHQSTDLGQDHAHDGQLATRKTADFEAIGLSLINPWDLDEEPT